MQHEKKTDLLVCAGFVAALMIAAAAALFAGTEAPPLPQGDVVLAGDGLTSATATYTVDGVTTSGAGTVAFVFDEAPPAWVKQEREVLALMAAIDSKMKQRAGLELLIAEANVIIARLQAEIEANEAVLGSIDIGSPTITLDGPSTATLTRRTN